MEIGFKEESKIMWRVFQWAYANGIEVTLRKEVSYGLNQFPVLIFRKGKKAISHAFYPLTDISARIDSVWRKIALELCVIPLDLSYLNTPPEEERD